MTITNVEMARNLAAAFFYEHAGFGYDPKKETPEDGKSRHAAELAEAEELVQLNTDYRYTLERDPVITSADFSDEKPPYKLWVVTLAKGETIVESLCGIDFGRGNDPKKDAYLRVVKAELALSHKQQLRREAEQAATEDAYRALAQVEYGSDDIVISDDAQVSETENGAWVTADVFVMLDDTDE